MLPKQKHDVHNASADEILSPLPSAFRHALLSMYNREPQLGSDGERHDLDGKTLIEPKSGMWLYQLCREIKPKASLEIGLAYGFSTAYLLAAIWQNGTGRHTAVDPCQTKLWQGIGFSLASRLGMSDRLRFAEVKSASALPHFADTGEIFDLIFIDGNHRFDDVLIDFTLSAAICPIGGYIILDDLWMMSIRNAVAFIIANRPDFEVIETPVANLAAFRRVDKDKRDWNHYVEFSDTRNLVGLLRRGLKHVYSRDRNLEGRVTNRIKGCLSGRFKQLP